MCVPQDESERLKACLRGTLKPATWEDADIGAASLPAPLAASSPVGAAGETAGSQGYCAGWWGSSLEITAGRRSVRRQWKRRRRRRRRTIYLSPQDITTSHWIHPRWQWEKCWCVVGPGQRQRGGESGGWGSRYLQEKRRRRVDFLTYWLVFIACACVIMWCKC